MRIREATVADVDAIATTHVEAWRAAYPGLVPQAFINAMTIDERRALWWLWDGTVSPYPLGDETRPVVRYIVDLSENQAGSGH